MNEESTKRGQAGFSLIEMIIAMAITITITAVAGSLLAQSMNIRTRSSEKVDALADAQRALNIMSREIAGAGFNLSDNGLVAADSVTDANGNSTIRIRSNLNKYNTAANPFDPGTSVTTDAQNGIGTGSVGEDQGEDVKYFVYAADNTNLLARYDRYRTAGGSSTVLANRLDSLHIHYYAGTVTYDTAGCDITGASRAEVNPSAATYVVIAVCVQQDAVGTPGSPGYQPPANVLLVSDVALRNSNLLIY
ncbi:MAG: prepilin-type N-terminal cleavage/methylation domain-containing protein [Acidobacteriota bacterium]